MIDPAANTAHNAVGHLFCSHSEAFEPATNSSDVSAAQFCQQHVAWTTGSYLFNYFGVSGPVEFRQGAANFARTDMSREIRDENSSGIKQIKAGTTR